MKRRTVVLLALIALAGAGLGTATPSNSATQPFSAAKTCSSGYTHAVLPWGHKCLRRGQLRKVSGDRYYQRYGLHCHTGRLT